MSREAILGRVRAAIGRSAGAPVEPLDDWAFPNAMEAEDLVSRFMAEATAVNSETVEARDGRWADALHPFIPDAEAVFAGPGVDVAGLGLPVAKADQAATAPGVVVGIVRAVAGIAESGSVVVEADGAQLPSLLTETSVILLEKGTVVRGLEDLPSPSDAVRSRILVTGPSRTADIEKRIVLGAHGPKRLIIVLI